ncbi:MAG TPA: DUF58 domain-containing protein [bacterium]|nr:DUF58 domain-containing protein [bacterium]
MAGTRLTLRPSALGTKGLLLFAALALTFLATNYDNLFFLLLAFSAVLGVLDAFGALRNLAGIEVRAITVAPAPTGSERPVSITLAARRRTRFALEIAASLAGGPAELARLDLLQGGATAAGSVPPQPRGVQVLERLQVRSRFPFGFFVAQRTLAGQAELVTYPAPAAIAHDARGAAGVTGYGSTPAGLRPFRDGDASADVHWKATARRGSVVVKERERDHDEAVEIVLDLRLRPEALELALAQATTLALAARHGTPLVLHSQAGRVRVDPHRGGLRAALRWLATATGLPPDAPPPPAPRSGCRLPLDHGGSR